MGASQLPPLPAGFERTREAMHRLAEEVIKVAREHVEGGFSLIRSAEGFGTPVFGDEQQVRVEGAELVVRERDEERRGAITSLRAAADLVGPSMLPADLELSAEPLAIDPAAAEALAAAYEVGETALERLREVAGPDDDPTPPTLWPEHFDIAIEMGPEERGLRVNYGLSPGDEHHPEPYFYVGPWTARPQGELWNGIGGALERDRVHRGRADLFGAGIRRGPGRGGNRIQPRTQAGARGRRQGVSRTVRTERAEARGAPRPSRPRPTASSPGRSTARLSIVGPARQTC